MNKVFLTGNLTRDPEMSTTPSGISLCKFGLAVNRPYSKEKEVDFFNIIVWRGPAENCYKYLKKGNKVGISGSIQTRTYDKSDGTKASTFDIVAEEVEFLTTKQETNAVSGGSKTVEQKPQTQGSSSSVLQHFTPIQDDTLPF